MALPLHKSVFLYIIANVNNYRTCELAFLPLRIRETLLLNVPVMDVLWLETSRVADGVDMNSVWSAILSSRMDSPFFMEIWEKIQMHQPVYSKGTQLKPKDIYMEILGYAILYKDTPQLQQLLTKGYCNISHVFLDLLVGVRRCLGIANWNAFLKLNSYWRVYFMLLTKDDCVTFTRHYVQYYTKELSDARLVSLLLSDCGYTPKLISVYISEFTKTSLWKEKDFPSAHETLRKLVSTTESLTFSAIEHADSICVGDSTTQSYPAALRFIATEILTAKRPNLQAVQIQAIDTKTLARLISTIAPLFSDLSSPYAKPPINHIPYSYLKELKFLSLEKHHPSDITSESLLCECISDIIKYQQHLENVFFTGLHLAGPPSILQCLPMSLINFVHSINWKYLHFSDSIFSFSLFQSIIETYLHSLATHMKSLSLSGVKIGEPNGPLLKTNFIRMVDANIEHKQIVIRDTFLPLYAVTWFFSPLHHFRLHSLELDAATSLPNVSLLSVIASHPDLIIQVLCLKRIVIVHNHGTMKDFQLLFSKPGLRALIIKDCHIGQTGVLHAITAAIATMRYWPGKTLTYLSLEQNKLGIDNCSTIQNFFISLFRLQGIQDLGLDISANMLGPHHFTIIYNMWRIHANGQRLRQLKCDGNEIASCQNPFIQHIARQVCFY